MDRVRNLAEDITDGATKAAVLSIVDYLEACEDEREDALNYELEEAEEEEVLPEIEIAKPEKKRKLFNR